MNLEHWTIRAAALAALLALALAVGSIGCSAADPGAARYHCPMHPSYVSDRPGDCPICGMRLVAIEPPPQPAQAVPAPAAAGAHAAHQPAPVPDAAGLAPIELSADALRLAGVSTARAVKETVSRTIRTVGTVTVDETRVRHVHTKISGWIEQLSVNFTGQYVRRGQPLLSIYSPELVASQEEFLRAKAAAARFAASDLPEVRRGGEDLAAAARRRLQLFDVPEEFIATLDRTGTPQRTVTLLSPVSGFVTAKATFEGHQVEPGMELFTITDLSHVWIEGDFYEYDAAAVRLGQPARLTLPYDARAVRSSRVSYIYPALNAETRTLRVRFDAANPALSLKPGMFANIELDVARATALTIPDSAVLDTGPRQVVFVDAGAGRFEPREVRLGLRADGKAQVVAGLAEGEAVVVRANFLLDSESRLRAALAGAAPAPRKAPDGAQR